jgi:hypothetical protein
MLGLGCSLIFLAASAAHADEVDFYLFRTEYSSKGNKEAKFDVEVLETNAIDRDINRSKSYTCRVHPLSADSLNCIVRDVQVIIKADAEGAKTILALSDGVKPEEIVEIKAKKDGVFQVLLQHDRIFHVTLNPPFVGDNSMECEVSIMWDHMTGMIRCRSELFPEQKFMVRDLPVIGTRYGRLEFGATRRYYGEDNASWEKRNETAIAKVREAVAGMARLKKLTLAEATALSISFPVMNDDSPTYPVLIDGLAASKIELRGKVQHVHRGVEGRKGD